MRFLDTLVLEALGALESIASPLDSLPFELNSIYTSKMLFLKLNTGSASEILSLKLPFAGLLKNLLMFIFKHQIFQSLESTISLSLFFVFIYSLSTRDTVHSHEE